MATNQKTLSAIIAFVTFVLFLLSNIGIQSGLTQSTYFPGTLNAPTNATNCPTAPFAIPSPGRLYYIFRDPNAYPTKDSNPTNAPYHLGLDIFGDLGSTPVYAAYEGWAIRKKYSAIQIEHTLDNSWSGILPYLHVWTYYAHMAQNGKDFIEVRNPETGQVIQIGDSPVWVQKGQLIGFTGNYGTPHPHLHFSIKWRDQSELIEENVIDPSNYLGSNLDFQSGARATKTTFACRELPPPVLPVTVSSSKTIIQFFPWWKTFSSPYSQVYKVELDGNVIINFFPETGIKGNYVFTRFITPGVHTIRWYFYSQPSTNGVNSPDISQSLDNKNIQDAGVTVSEWPTNLIFLGGYDETPPLPPTTDPQPIPGQIPPSGNTDSAVFLADLSLPDGSVVTPSQSLTKTWRMKNTGSATWGNGYQLVFLRGDQMGAPSSINVPSTELGQSVDLSVNLTAPATPGIYAGYWRLRNSQGTYFGPEIWVKISIQMAGSHITVFTADPASPATTDSVRFRVRVENFPNFRAMRIKVDGEVKYELGATEYYWDWNTNSYAVGQHNIVIEVADQTDTSWSRAESRSMMFSLTGNTGSTNHVPNKPNLVSPYDWYVYYSGNTANLCAQANGDPDGDPITGYYFEVSGAESWNSGWVASSCVTTGGLGPHTYGWHVKVRDSYNAESIWSDQWHFTLVNPSLSIAQMYFEPQDANSERVKVRACTTGQGGIGITMRVSVNEANDGSGNGAWNMIYELGVPCFNDIDAPIWNTPRFSDGQHRVRVEAHGLNTGWDGATVREEVYTLPHRRPAGPYQYAPVPTSRDTREAIYLNSRTVQFKWDSPLRSTSYTLHVGTSQNPQADPNPVFRQTFGSGTTDYSVTFNQDYPVLYWQVTANGDAGSSSSNDQLFGIDRVVPTCTIQQLPAIGYENAFTVRWSGIDNLSGIYLFDIQYLDTGRGAWSDWLLSQPATKTFEMFTGQPGHTYSFRCQAKDKANNQGTYPINPDTVTKIDPAARPPEPWWNQAFYYKRNLIILNNDSDTMPVHFPVRLHFDNSTTPTAAEIYNASLTSTKGNDVRIVYQNTTELNRSVQNFSASQIDIWLPLQAGLGGGATDSTNYQIYYGNASAGSPPANVNAVFLPEADANTTGLWHFYEGTGGAVADTSGRSHNGSFANAGWANGFTGWTGVFNGSNSSVSIAHSDDFNSNQLTIEAWVYVDVFNGQAHPVVIKRIPYTPGGFEFRFTGGRQIMLIVDLTTGNWDIQSNALEAGRWYHVAGVFNGSNKGCMYVNGVQSRCRDLTPGSFKYNSGQVTIGYSHQGDGDKFFPGKIQHVRISNIARTDFSYALIDIAPTTAAGTQQTPPAQGKPDLAIVSMSAYPNLTGGILVQAVFKNQGALPTQNGFFNDLYVNHLPTGSGDYTGSLSFWVNDSISANSVVTLTTVINSLPTTSLAPLAPGSEITGTLYSQIDSAGSVSETDNANNIFTQGLEVCLASPDAFEGDDLFTGATAISIGIQQRHNFDHPGDEDWVKFTAIAGKEYLIQTAVIGGATDTYLYLYGTNGTTLLASNDDAFGTLGSQIIWKAPASGTYYVQVKHWNPNSGGCANSYDVSIMNLMRVFVPLIKK